MTRKINLGYFLIILPLTKSISYHNSLNLQPFKNVHLFEDKKFEELMKKL